MEGEVRSFDNKKVIQLVNQIKTIFENEAGRLNAQLEFSSDWDFKPYTVAEGTTLYNEISNVLKKVNLKPEPRISLGGSDANSLNELGIPSVNLGIGAQNPHSNDEFVLIEDLQKSAEIAMELIKK